jgi:tetratricopeptide (TPR) repeat protein
VTGKAGNSGFRSGFLIKAAALTGLLLSTAICAVLIFIALRPEKNTPSRDMFQRLLRNYDLAAGTEGGNSGGGEPETLSAMLDTMEKNTQGVESWLSLLKRRRALAKAHPRTLAQYQEASRRAAAAFPWSEPLAAVALASALLGPAADRTEAIRGYGALINDTRLIPLALAAAVLRGDLGDPSRAAENRGETLLSLGLPSLSRQREDRLIVNLVLLKLLNRDYQGAEAQILGISRQGTLEQGAFLGEYYYDFGNPARSAEIFNRMAGDQALLRSADALWLGGRTESARNIWLALGNTQSNTQGNVQGNSGGAVPAGPALRSLYNLGASAPTAEEGEKWFTLLYRAGEENPALREEPGYDYGLIAYTRNLAPREALDILDNRASQSPQGPANSTGTAALRDLEILRRRGELWTMERTAAETWLLLGRYPEDSRLYQWAAWYFDYQRRREDSVALARTAGYRGIRGPWLDLSAALGDLESGRLEEAEQGLRSISLADTPIWQAEANLGLVLEARRAPAEALEHYEIAASRVKDSREASRLQLRIAGCLRALGRKEESRRALLYSLDLNPANLSARLELRRLEN